MRRVLDDRRRSPLPCDGPLNAAASNRGLDVKLSVMRLPGSLFCPR